MRKDVKDKLLPSVDYTDELEILLQSHYCTASQLSETQVLYGNELVVEYYGKNNKKHSSREIKAIYQINGASNDMLDALEAKSLDALRKDNGVGVASKVLFAYLPVSGIFRYKDLFQIIEVPQNAPRIESAHGNQQPLILEVSYPKSNHELINGHRQLKAINEASLLLNAFIKWGLRDIGISAHSEWIILNAEQVGSWETKCAQVGYILPGNGNREFDDLGFSVVNGLSGISSMDMASYYAREAVWPGEKFSVPEQLAIFVDKYYSLAKDEKESFIRSSYWKRIGSDTFHISHTNAYIALVNSIESLIPQEQAEYCCISCQKEMKKGLTQLFHDFVEKYVPGVESSYRKELYGIRSKYTHGKKLMPFDIDANAFRFTPDGNFSENHYRAMSQVVQYALVNWIMSRK